MSEIFTKLEMELYIIGHYQRGCYFIFSTINAAHKKAIDEMLLNKSAFIFSFICSTCDIMNVTPDQTEHERIIKRLQNGTHKG